MGHRALIAYEQGDGRFTVLYSHWGAGELADRITPETPLGGENDLEPAYLDAFAAALDSATDGEIEGKMAEAPETTAIERTPVAVGITAREFWRETIDYIHHEAVYIVDRDFTVTEYTTYFTDFTYEHDPSRGVATTTGGSYERGVYRGFRNAIEDRMQREDDYGHEQAEADLIRLLIGRYEDNLSDHIVALSSALSDDHWSDHPCAFIDMSGRTRVLGEMYPTNVKSPPRFEIPDEFQSIKTAEGERVELTG